MQFAFYSLFMLIIVAMGIVFALLSRRLARGASTIWIIAMAVKNNLPLPDLVDAQAGEFSGRRGQRMRDLADMLREGVPLPVAVDHYGQLMPNNGRLAMRVGADSGTLAENLEATAEELTERHDFETFNNYYLLCYMLFVVNALFAVTGFLFYFILPKYIEIAEGFGFELPPLLAFLTACAEALFYFSPLYLILQTVLLFAVIGITVRFFPVFGFLQHFPTLRRFARGLAYPFLPLGRIVDWCVPQRYTPDLLRFLAINARAERPLGQTLDSLARYHPSRAVQKRLEQCVQQLNEGSGIWESLHWQRFITAREMGLLQAAEMSGQLPFTLEEQIHSRRLVRVHRQGITIELARTTGVVLLSLWVGLIAIGFFAPLVQLINDLQPVPLFTKD